MNSKHTPGPWKVEDRRGAALPNVRIIAEQHEIAQVSDVHMRDYLVSGWTNEQADLKDSLGLANARLIAAAPDLLEACKSLVAWNEGASSVSPVTELCQLYVVINKCKAAIKLAEEGRPE